MGNYNYIGMRFNPESANKIRDKLTELKLLQKEDSTERYSIFYFPVKEKDLNNWKDELNELVSQAIADSI